MIIFVDMDEVMADAYMAHIEIYNQEFNAQLCVEECFGREVWQCVPKEHQKNIKDHTRRIGFFRDLRVIPDSQEVLLELSKKYKVYIASAAMEFPDSLKEKSDWLDLHFPFIPWQNRILCGDKHILKGDVLIDDRSKNLEPFNGRSIMFSSPHNANENSFERAHNWQEIADKLL
ncbi:5' nucleotidase, NT5C type [Flagellimonas zhangzhouensis]|uniref:5'(3')-deoxyribonucleotidase n=1 Tax=Flagellimonas zhangzhouensis TaxID=1073328 RepID=A0A1H2YND8_9FLAO|nr:5'(3')-deoxyribonucleotidase [Allomuricauda zhangzhouensis]SDR01122.1 5'(3')-deoxyribonucleotidase [Allomuricauda zhangzhouensis]SDX06762.1 5'(3')-deoxyribonucleotidase [Allomuricauda zhangzhouensis]